MDSQFQHHGVLGMKWGIRRYQPYPKGHKGGKEIGEAAKRSTNNLSGKPSKESSASSAIQNKEPSKTIKKSVKDMSDAELKTAIERMRLEDQYRELMKKVNPPKSKKGREMVKKMLEDSAKNIGGQLSTVAMGMAVNKMAKAMFKDLKRDIVNPYKGQKDK